MHELEVGQEYKFRYHHPMLDVTRTYKGQVLNLDWYGAVRILLGSRNKFGMWDGAENFYMNPDHIKKAEPIRGINDKRRPAPRRRTKRGKAVVGG